MALGNALLLTKEVVMKLIIAVMLLSSISFGAKRLELMNIYCNTNTDNEEVTRCVISGKFTDTSNPGWQKKYSEEFVLQQSEKNQLNAIITRMINKKKYSEEFVLQQSEKNQLNAIITRMINKKKSDEGI